MLLLYAVIPVGAVLPEGMSQVESTDVAIAYRDVEGPPPTEQDELVRYGSTVADLASTGAVLPFRFGTLVDDHEALTTLVVDREDEWRQRLGAVRDKVEMVVHADTAHAPAPERPQSGREYVLSRVASSREHDRLIAGLTLALGDVASELRELSSRDGLRLAVLVPDDRVPELRSALERWEAAEPGWSSRATGPWPPFSFTSSGVAS